MPAGKQLAAVRAPRAAGKRLGAIALGLKLPAQPGHRLEGRVAAKDVPHHLRLALVDQELFVLERITDGRRAAHPQTFLPGRRDLVADALPSYLALELREG